MKQYYIFTYGCQMNESDSERLAHQLETAGYTNTENFKEADLIILNTCCVRETAEHKIYGRIGELKHLKEKNKNLIIAITGCMAQKTRRICLNEHLISISYWGLITCVISMKWLKKYNARINIRLISKWIIPCFMNWKRNQWGHSPLGCQS